MCEGARLEAGDAPLPLNERTLWFDLYVRRALPRCFQFTFLAGEWHSRHALLASLPVPTLWQV
jgi:hypothetical protein